MCYASAEFHLCCIAHAWIAVCLRARSATWPIMRVIISEGQHARWIHVEKLFPSPSSSSSLEVEPVAYAAPDARFFRELKNPFILQLEAPLSLLHRFTFISPSLLVYTRAHAALNRSRDSWSAGPSVYSRDSPFTRGGSRRPWARTCDLFATTLEKPVEPST